GLVLGDVTELATEEFDENTVIGQEPDEGETKPEGSEVDIVVAKKPEGRGKGNGNGNGGGGG
ncbi:MAG: PASTA domain-containing protein, partial [Actinomycetota bacterium]